MYSFQHISAEHFIHTIWWPSSSSGCLKCEAWGFLSHLHICVAVKNPLICFDRVVLSEHLTSLTTNQPPLSNRYGFKSFENCIEYRESVFTFTTDIKCPAPPQICPPSCHSNVAPILKFIDFPFDLKFTPPIGHINPSLSGLIIYLQIRKIINK
ncbi:hypothetical protein EGR_10711 [Echinococcus granulosus]|uniref:Uncharacterized protein n=1 Tax=Echinococcus granulosus TaxID=6210 RepID=W6U047_ECHGR|nr:hypothetical protein EGR_10711 [Echinococcus granulosus]EUB54435.1 hypothetical protein EGR_10711 [Echinococcus granulosus]